MWNESPPEHFQLRSFRHSANFLEALVMFGNPFQSSGFGGSSPWAQMSGIPQQFAGAHPVFAQLAQNYPAILPYLQQQFGQNYPGLSQLAANHPGLAYLAATHPVFAQMASSHPGILPLMAQQF